MLACCEHLGDLAHGDPFFRNGMVLGTDLRFLNHETVELNCIGDVGSAPAVRAVSDVSRAPFLARQLDQVAYQTLLTASWICGLRTNGDVDPALR